MSAGSKLTDVFEVVKAWGGIDVATLSHEGLLYDFVGAREDAEKLAALAPALLSNVRKSISNGDYVVVGSPDKATFIYGGEDFTLVIRGERDVMHSYVNTLIRLMSGKEIRCGACGAILDKEVITCPSCGLRYPFTLPSCPRCGGGPTYRKCPRCGTLITSEGFRVVKDKAPLALFFAASLGMLGVGALTGNPVVGAVSAAVLAGVGALTWFIAPSLTVVKR